MLTQERSSRTFAILRIGLVIFLWIRFSPALAIYGSSSALSDIGLNLLLLVASIAMFAGFLTSRAVAVTAITLVMQFALFGITNIKPLYSYPLMLLIATICILAFADCGSSMSVDRWLSLRRGGNGRFAANAELAPVWPLYLIRLQLSVVYLYGAVAKSKFEFISGMRMSEIAVFAYPQLIPWTSPHFSYYFIPLSILSVALEYALAIGLWVPSLQRYLIPLGLIFHFFLFIFLPIGIFSTLCCFLYLAFLDPNAVHRGIDLILGHSTSNQGPPAPAAG